MSRLEVSDDALAAAVAVLQRCDAVEAAYLLGSAAAGRLRADSDIDVAVLPRHHGGLCLDDRRSLVVLLTAAFGRPVDLGVLSTANVVYAKEAVAKGRLLFQRDRMRTARFAMLALSMYAALQVARQEVLRAYAA